MIKCRSEMEPRRLEIDLSGPMGNAFALMGYARRLGRELGWSQAHCEAIVKTMKMSNYENLIKTFDEFFGDYVTLYR